MNSALWSGFFASPWHVVLGLIEIVLVAFLFYRILGWLQGTRAEQLLKGLAVFGAFSVVISYLQLSVIKWLIDKIWIGFVVALPIVFQPELRRLLEQLGRGTLLNRNKSNKASLESVLNEITEAVRKLSERKVGALIVLVRSTGISEYTEDGVEINSSVSAELLINIFEPNTPLHDGAVVIAGDRIHKASCFLPLANDSSVSKDMGTRHRAALGITEVSDALAIVASEETGAVSLASEGQIYRNLSETELKDFLLRGLEPPAVLADKLNKKIIRKNNGETQKKRLALKGLSAALALLLWLYISFENSFNMPLAMSSIELKYYNVSADMEYIGPKSVSARAWGRNISETEKELWNAYVDVNGLPPGQYDLPVMMDPPKGTLLAKVLPDKVTVEVLSMQKNEYPIAVEITETETSGVQIYGYLAVPDKCLLQGNAETIAQISKVTAPIRNIAGGEPGWRTVKLQAENSSGDTVSSGLKIIPEQIEIFVSAGPLLETREATVRFEPGKISVYGYNIKQWSTQPQTVTILGPKNVIDSFGQFIDLKPVDVSALAENNEGNSAFYDQEIELDVPNDLKSYPDKVRVIMELEQILTEVKP
ncbi:MAG: diadenylate cyclase CdaA [Syntrophomonadaceae bacterium]|nr:diadenylate cyclase CdaA [Syntrophomonadaceae bacterium]